MNTSPSRLFFIFFISIISFININSVYSADTNAVAYFPLKVGNKYVYKSHYISNFWVPPNTVVIDTIYVGIILKDTIILGRKYFFLTGFPNLGDNKWYRVDTTTGSLMMYNTANTCQYYNMESFVDSLAALQGNNMTNCGYLPNGTFKCSLLDTLKIFSVNTYKKVFDRLFTAGYHGSSITSKYAKRFGVYFMDYSTSGQNGNSKRIDSLKGCFLNGVVYGDTTSFPSYLNIPEFFPLNLGNVFVYKGHFTSDQFNSDSIYKCRIIKDTLISGKKYFKFSGFPFYDNNKWYRIDTLTGSLRYYNTSNTCQYYNNETVVDSLGAFLGAGIRNCGQTPVNTSHTCTSIDTVKLFSNITYRKEFTYNYSSGSNQVNRVIRYAKKYGPYYRYEYTTTPSARTSTYTLKGCVLNGVVYGDTSAIPIGVQNISTNVPDNFYLSQNYPNPFNPTTKISFALPEDCSVNLNVYDLTGRKVASLIAGESLKAGEYEVNFDGSNLASGIYFYSIETEGFTQTKKMILLK